MRKFMLFMNLFYIFYDIYNKLFYNEKNLPNKCLIKILKPNEN